MGGGGKGESGGGGGGGYEGLGFLKLKPICLSITRSFLFSKEFTSSTNVKPKINKRDGTIPILSGFLLFDDIFFSFFRIA